MLVDAGDAAPDHLARIAERRDFAPDLDLPAVGAIAPVRILISVDLPAPFEPISARTSPGMTAMSAPLQRDQVAVDLGQADAADQGRRPCSASAGVGGQPALPAQEQQAVVADRGQQDSAGDDLLHELGDAHQRQAEQHRAEQEGAERRPEHRADAARRG